MALVEPPPFNLMHPEPALVHGRRQDPRGKGSRGTGSTWSRHCVCLRTCHGTCLCLAQSRPAMVDCCGLNEVSKRHCCIGSFSTSLPTSAPVTDIFPRRARNLGMAWAGQRRWRPCAADERRQIARARNMMLYPLSLRHSRITHTPWLHRHGSIEGSCASATAPSETHSVASPPRLH